MNRIFLLCVSVSLWFNSSADAQSLPDTKPLTESGDLARLMVDGMHVYLDRELAGAAKNREALWKVETSSLAAYRKSVEPNRSRLSKMLGTIDPRLPSRLEHVGGPGAPALVAETQGYKVLAVRWSVLPGVDGEGLLLEPSGPAVADVVAIPDADQTPEQIVGLSPGVPAELQFARRLAENGCRVLVPVLIDRSDTYSGNSKLKKATNQSHREFVYRMAYEMGRTLAGYEVQKVLAAVDWFAADGRVVGVIGIGEGGWLAYLAAALDSRIRAVDVGDVFGPREGLWQEPIDRNVWGLLREFGDAELVRLFGEQRHLRMSWVKGPAVAGPPPPRQGRAGAAPGRLVLRPEAEFAAEVKRAAQFAQPIQGPGVAVNITAVYEKRSGEPLPAGRMDGFLLDLRLLAGRPIKEDAIKPAGPAPSDLRKPFDPAPRQKRQFDQLVAYTQKLWRDSDATRREFWKKADVSSPEKWEASCEWYRKYFHEEVIGKLPEAWSPLNPRTRQVYDEPKWMGYEVVLDVYPDVIATGILLLPKDLKPGEKRPVVVCQHGLEGRPTDVYNPKQRTRAYNSYGAQLADRGYIVYAPQNPYIFENHFRQLQRKANPLKLSLFSFIIAQHKRTLDWLETLPQVDPKRIAFYGLSYGGKTAMRVPAVEKRYCLSICSGDFNEWIGKNVSVDLGTSYMWTREYEMYEFDLGNTFNYAEMAYLIAPRPFMVERGHDDGVGIDEMVAWEYARVQYLYANKLKIPDRTTIEYFPGGHEINGKGTFAFLQKHLQYP